MLVATEQLSIYDELYNYLPVMDGDQIWRLRKIAVGILDLSDFSDEEMRMLELKLLEKQEAYANVSF